MRSAMMAFGLSAVFCLSGCAEADNSPLTTEGDPGDATTVKAEESDEGQPSTTPPLITTTTMMSSTTTSSLDTTTSTEPEIALVVVEEVRLYRAIPGDVSCTVEVTVFNNGPGTATGTEVRIEIKNLRGPGAPDAVGIEATLDGPAVVAAGETAFYSGRLGVLMAQGDVWLFDGVVDVDFEQDYMFFSRNNVGIACD